MFYEFEQEKNIVLLWFAYDILGELQALYTACKQYENWPEVEYKR
jgi:hypothetical protein